MGDPMTEAVVRQRKRVVAAVLGHVEREIVPLLPTAERDRAYQELRQKVLQSTAAYQDFVLDAMRGATQGVWVSDDVLEMLADISSQLRNQEG